MSTTLVTDRAVLAVKAPLEPVPPQSGTVYTDTVVFSPPEQHVADAPYQIAIIDLDAGERLTVRIEGDFVMIGDRVELARLREGVPYFRKIQ